MDNLGDGVDSDEFLRAGPGVRAAMEWLDAVRVASDLEPSHVGAPRSLGAGSWRTFLDEVELARVRVQATGEPILPSGEPVYAGLAAWNALGREALADPSGSRLIAESSSWFVVHLRAPEIWVAVVPSDGHGWPIDSLEGAGSLAPFLTPLPGSESSLLFEVAAPSLDAAVEAMSKLPMRHSAREQRSMLQAMDEEAGAAVGDALARAAAREEGSELSAAIGSRSSEPKPKIRM